MTLLKMKMYCLADMNDGREIFHTHEAIELHKLITQVVQWLIELKQYDTKDMSSLKIKFSKRPIKDTADEALEKEMQMWREAAGDDLVIVQDDDLVPQLGITWGELNKLNEDKTWTNAFTLANTRNRENYTGDEIDAIKLSFKLQYEHTKFYPLLNGRL